MQLSNVLRTCLLALAVAAIACSETPLANDDDPRALSPAEGSTTQHEPVLRLPDFATVGSSTIVRTRNGVNFRVTTSELDPGSAYTLWFVVFNNPAECGVPGCTPDDIVNADAEPDMMYAAGMVVGGSRTATFAGRMRVGNPSGSVNAPVGLPSFGLTDPFGAVIILAVHEHGPKLPAYMPDMIQSLDGGCTDAGVPAAGVSSPWNDHPGFGARGPNTCQTIQIAHYVP
jgi:hypothetical protein